MIYLSKCINLIQLKKNNKDYSFPIKPLKLSRNLLKTRSCNKKMCQKQPSRGAILRDRLQISFLRLNKIKPINPLTSPLKSSKKLSKFRKKLSQNSLANARCGVHFQYSCRLTCPKKTI